MGLKKFIAGMAQGVYALALSWFALIAKLPSNVSWLLWAYVGLLVAGACWTFSGHRKAWRFSMFVVCAPVTLALLWVIVSGVAFAIRAPLYADSPASIFVALILGFTASIPPLSIALLLFIWRRDLDARE